MFNLEAIPINIRVIGYGHETENAITQLRELGYNGLSAEVFNQEQQPCITSDDEMVILLVSNQSEGAIMCAKSYKEAGVLTIAVCTEGIELPIGCVDSQTKVSVNKMHAVAKIILDVIFIPSMFCIDFNDIDMMLRDTGIFIVVEGYGYGVNRVADTMNQLNAESKMSASQTVMVCLYNNPKSTAPLVASELQSVVEVANKLPENKFLWCVSNDTSIADDAVRISLITTKK